MNELNRLNIEKASEYMAKLEEMNAFFLDMSMVSQSENVETVLVQAIACTKDLLCRVSRVISELLVIEYN